MDLYWRAGFLPARHQRDKNRLPDAAPIARIDTAGVLYMSERGQKASHVKVSLCFWRVSHQCVTLTAQCECPLNALTLKMTMSRTQQSRPGLTDGQRRDKGLFTTHPCRHFGCMPRAHLVQDHGANARNRTAAPARRKNQLDPEACTTRASSVGTACTTGEENFWPHESAHGERRTGRGFHEGHSWRQAVPELDGQHHPHRLHTAHSGRATPQGLTPVMAIATQ